MKLALIRNNDAYAKFLIPAMEKRSDFQIQSFPQGTETAEITGWIVEHADRIRNMEKVFMDQTCYEAGEKVPSVKVQYRNWTIWNDVKTNYGGFDRDVFQAAATALLTKETAGETIAEVVSSLLAKETPTKVFVVKAHMGDHNIFGRSFDDTQKSDHEADEREDHEKLKALLTEVTGLPATELKPTFSGIQTEEEVAESDVCWVFLDRHFPSCKQWEWQSIPEGFRQFRVPVENLIEDAVKFGINLDEEQYSLAICEIVGGW